MLYQESQGNDQKDREGLTWVKAINAVAWNGLASAVGLDRAAKANFETRDLFSLPSHFRNSHPCASPGAQPQTERPDLHCCCCVSREALGCVLCLLSLAVKS